jgi:hypothetical protein
MASTLQFIFAVEFLVFFRQCVARNGTEEVLCCCNESVFLDSFLRKNVFIEFLEDLCLAAVH